MIHFVGNVLVSLIFFALHWLEWRFWPTLQIRSIVIRVCSHYNTRPKVFGMVTILKHHSRWFLMLMVVKWHGQSLKWLFRLFHHISSTTTSQKKIIPQSSGMLEVWNDCWNYTTIYLQRSCQKNKWDYSTISFEQSL